MAEQEDLYFDQLPLPQQERLLVEMLESLAVWNGELLRQKKRLIGVSGAALAMALVTLNFRGGMTIELVLIGVACWQLGLFFWLRRRSLRTNREVSDFHFRMTIIAAEVGAELESHEIDSAIKTAENAADIPGKSLLESALERRLREMRQRQQQGEQSE